MMYLELFLKKYKEAILINLDVCQKQALHQLKADGWKSIRTLKFDTFFANADHIEVAKKNIKSIYESQKIDFSQFSTKPMEKGGFRAEIMEDLMMEIAKADVANNIDLKTHFLSGSQPTQGGGTRMLCNETLDLSIINVNVPFRKYQLVQGLEAMLDSNKKPSEPPLISVALGNNDKITTGGPNNDPSPEKMNNLQRKNNKKSRSIDIKEKVQETPQPAKKINEGHLRHAGKDDGNILDDKSSLDLIVQLTNLIVQQNNNHCPPKSKASMKKSPPGRL